MSDLRILRNGYVDFEKKYNGQFMIQMLNYSYPDILNVPFFTHCKKMLYNKETMAIEDMASTKIKGGAMSLLSKYVPKGIKKSINRLLKRGALGSDFSKEVMRVLHTGNNENNLRRLVGDDVFNRIEEESYNLVFVIRGIVLCKLFDNIGIRY